MNTTGIERSFREKVCAKVRIVLEGDERFRVFTPFLFEDGDHLAIVLKKSDSETPFSASCKPSSKLPTSPS